MEATKKRMLNLNTFQLLLTDTGILKDCFYLLNEPEDIGIFFAGGILAPEIESRLAESAQRLSASGSGIERQSALGAALGEVLERYSFITWLPSEEESTLANYCPEWEELPFQFSSVYSKEDSLQLLKKTSRIRSIVQENYSKSMKFTIPIGLISCADGARFNPTTNGMACGPDWEFAALRALYEVVERSTLMVAWYMNIHGVVVKPENVLPDEWQDLINKFRGKLFLRLFVSDIELPVIVAAMHLATPQRNHQRLALGSACRSSVYEAAVAAISEAALAFHSLGGFGNPRLDKIIPMNFADHMTLYQGEKSDLVLDWLKPIHLKEEHFNYYNKQLILDEVCRIVKNAGYSPIFIDMTPTLVKNSGFKVTRAIVPRLIPLLIGRNVPLFKKGFENAKSFSVGFPITKGVGYRDDPHPFP